jgi:hypothetical protein
LDNETRWAPERHFREENILENVSIDKQHYNVGRVGLVHVKTDRFSLEFVCGTSV